MWTNRPSPRSRSARWQARSSHAPGQIVLRVMHRQACSGSRCQRDASEDAGPAPSPSPYRAPRRSPRPDPNPTAPRRPPPAAPRYRRRFSGALPQSAPVRCGDPCPAIGGCCRCDPQIDLPAAAAASLVAPPIAAAPVIQMNGPRSFSQTVAFQARRDLVALLDVAPIVCRADARQRQRRASRFTSSLCSNDRLSMLVVPSTTTRRRRSGPSHASSRPGIRGF